MRTLIRQILPLLALVVSFQTYAQPGRQQKKPLKMECILQNAYIPVAEKPAFDMGVEEPNMLIASKSDSIITAGVDAVISTIARGQDKKWELVYNTGNYWIWLTGLNSVTVRKDQKVKAGDAIGVLSPGQPLEIMIYDFETPIAPQKVMECPQL